MCPLNLIHIARTGTCKRTSEPMYPTLLNGKHMMAYTRLGSRLLYVGFRLHLHLQPIQKCLADPVVSAKYAWVPWNPSIGTFRTLELGLCFRLRHNRKSNRKSRNFGNFTKTPILSRSANFVAHSTCSYIKSS